ncbi:hypothetical protein BJY04DRAFT_212395 [Aspergillus karnatakaensis]|uniref:uncharacterized protein n=1 Tax=Aspergillus karnatakaensis TaxID=1810916 RepID=UPI003CCD5D6D
MILLTLDYPSLAHLSALNTKIEALLKTRPWYKLILEYCASALKSMARLKILHLHTAASISKAFFNPNCSSPGCTALTDNLFLPTCRRYCNSCLGTTPTSTAVCSYFVIEDYNISWEECAANMPTMRSADAGFQSFVCALEDDVVVYAREKYGKARIIPASFKARFWSSLTTIRFPFVDSESKGVEFGRWCRACVEAFDAHMRLWTELETVSRREEDNKRMGEELKEKAETVYNTKQLLWHVQSGDPVDVH